MALLDIDILARLTRQNGRQRVPMLGRRHDNPVHVLVFEGPVHVDDALRNQSIPIKRESGSLAVRGTGRFEVVSQNGDSRLFFFDANQAAHGHQLQRDQVIEQRGPTYRQFKKLSLGQGGFGGK